MIAIIEGSGANIASVQFALKRLGVHSVLTSDQEIIRAASHVILPGVGTAKGAMAQLQKRGLIEIITQLKQPVLGICLGMQLFYDFSREGNVRTLEIIPGEIVPIARDEKLSLPHMGWNKFILQNKSCALTQDIASQSYVYFVHSYMAKISDHTVAYARHGADFSAIVQYKNFYGVQFHPERSGAIGANILANFLRIDSSCNYIQQ